MLYVLYVPQLKVNEKDRVSDRGNTWHPLPPGRAYPNYLNEKRRLFGGRLCRQKVTSLSDRSTVEQFLVSGSCQISRREAFLFGYSLPPFGHIKP